MSNQEDDVSDLATHLRETLEAQNTLQTKTIKIQVADFPSLSATINSNNSYQKDVTSDLLLATTDVLRRYIAEGLITTVEEVLTVLDLASNRDINGTV